MIHLRRAWVASALLLSGAVMAQNAPVERYTLKDDAPRIGSNIKHDVATMALPLDKAWAELTPAQMESFKSNYETMAAGDEPPYPLHGSKTIVKAISAAQKNLLVSGRLTVVARIDSQGVAQSVQVLDTPDARMSEFVAHVMLIEKYKPALCKGEPCAMDYPLRVKLGVTH